MKRIIFAALERRNLLEARLIAGLPSLLRDPASRILTYVTGIAPSGAVPPSGNREWRARLFTLFALIAGALVPGAGLLMLHGMRSFSSVVGHHATHGGGRWIRLAYDIVSAAFWLPRFDAYQKDHRRHHAYAAGPEDADQRFIAYLGARFESPARFVATMLDPRFHAKFAWARVRVVLFEGPAWRRIWAVLAAAAMWSPGWIAVAVIGFQAATLLQWATEHLWGRRPVGKNAVETAVAVTFGRLLVPSADDRMLWPRLAVYALFRFVFLSGDLPNHDLHHLGRGPWTETPWVRTRLLEEGRIALRQTVGLREMFRLVFASARGEELPPREMAGDRMLGM